MRKVFIVFCILAFGFNVFAQPNTADSLAIYEKNIDSFYQQGAFADALQVAEQAYVWVQRKYEPTDSIYLAHLGVYNFFLSKNGKYDEAEASMQEELQLIEQSMGRKSMAYGMSANNLAAMYTRMARLSEAEPLMLENLEIWKSLLGREHPYYIISLNNYASLLADLEKYDEAEEKYYECAQLYRKTLGDNDLKYASALNNLAHLYGKQQKYIAAAPLHREVLAIYQQSNMTEHPEYASALHNLASVLQAMAETEEAEKLHLQAIEIKKKALGRFHPSYLDGLNNLAHYYIETSQLKKAEELSREALSINSLHQLKLPLNHSSFFDSLQLQTFNYPGIAITSVSRLLDICQKMQAQTQDASWEWQIVQGAMTANQLLMNYQQSFNSENDRINLLAKAPVFAEQGINNLLSVKKTSPAQLEQAFSFTEQTKSAALSVILRSKFALHFGGIPNDLIQEQKQLVTEKNKIQSQLFNKGGKDLQLLQQLNTVDAELSAFRKKLEEKYPKYYQLKHAPSQISLAKTQKNLPSNTAIIEYFVGEKQSAVMIITAQGSQLLPISIQKEQLKQQLRIFRQTLTDYNFIHEQEKLAYNNFCEESSQLYELLFQPIQQKLDPSIQHLVIIPDHILNYLPFEVLIKKIPKNQSQNYQKLDYLMQDYSISYNYSAQLWWESEQQPMTKNQEMLAMAAVYHGNKNAQPVVRGPWVEKVRGVLHDIPLSREEVKTLAQHFNGTFYYGEEATEELFIKEAQKYGVIHLALHGLTNTQYPIRSGLLFSESDPNKDNLLQSHEIGNLNLQANLVVLSACETGFGQVKDGEGVISIARAFLYAGAPSLTVSLWQIQDESTAYLMKKFYANLAKGQTKSTALRKAKQQYLSQYKGAQAHPAYWAAFIQMGNDQPITISQKGRKTSFFWLIAGFLALGTLGLIIILKRNLRKREE